MLLILVVIEKLFIILANVLTICCKDKIFSTVSVQDNLKYFKAVSPLGLKPL
jgi:hypothetical protein